MFLSDYVTIVNICLRSATTCRLSSRVKSMANSTTPNTAGSARNKQSTTSA